MCVHFLEYLSGYDKPAISTDRSGSEQLYTPAVHVYMQLLSHGLVPLHQIKVAGSSHDLHVWHMYMWL